MTPKEEFRNTLINLLGQHNEALKANIYCLSEWEKDTLLFRSNFNRFIEKYAPKETDD